MEIFGRVLLTNKMAKAAYKLQNKSSTK